jgi:phosphatidylserine/phosphatidylglycerophosphate/cardiolipin synthase-like enzyme
MHNKIGIFDGRSVEFGSFNWTQSANTKNYENALFTSDPKRVELYQRYWDWVWSNAQPADGPHGAPSLTPGPPEADGKPIGFNGASFPLAVFSPGGGTMDMILSAIRASRSTIAIAMFSFTQQEVADALLERKQAGVQVRLVVDLSQSRTSPTVIDFLRKNGFDLRLSSGKGSLGVMHNKYAVFDGALIETGSYNWTKNAEENNFENADFSNDAPLVSAFAKNFESLWNVAKPAADAPPGSPGGSSSSGSGSRSSSFLPKTAR